MSIRLRLTLLYTAILALTLTSFSGILFVTQSRSILGGSKQIIASVARRIAARHPGMRSLEGHQLPPLPPGDDAPKQGIRTRTIYAQLLSPNGKVIDRSENLEEITLPLSDAGLQAARNGESWVEIGQVDGERLLIHSEPVKADGLVTEIVQVAHSHADQDQYLSTLRRNLLIGSGIVILAAFGVGWVLSGLVLRPIHGITQTARAIGTERDLSRRVQHTGPDDEIGQLATTFNAMLTELQIAYRQQQQFVADVSHELRTPLTTIRGNLALLHHGPVISAEEKEDILDDLVDESERLIRLVNDLLALARAESRQPLRIEPIQVQPLIEDVCRQAKLLDPDRIITCAPLLDVTVAGDQDALKQVLLILIDNAVKHTTGAITMTTTAVDESVAIGVRDDGPGIDPVIIPHLFERFYRGDDAQDKPGLGLGLPIAKALAEAQNGTIAVQSQGEQGAAVIVTLPRC